MINGSSAFRVEQPSAATPLAIRFGHALAGRNNVLEDFREVFVTAFVGGFPFDDHASCEE